MKLIYKQRLRVIMNIAYLIKENEGCSFSEALTKSWKVENSKPKYALAHENNGADFHLHAFGANKYWLNMPEMQILPIQIIRYVKLKRIS